ncbi:hypothetical protein [Aeromonas salmonicida]|uniref:hypothetical protein n=1 Tax=Aeromonas salmonicida TaxID=645 RepID=UPI00125F138A|nr:hypothetical protein [Aeromonas salmonicida]
MEAAETNFTVTPEHTWSKHCLSAVKKFIKNAVVIDNEPVLAREHARADTVAIPLNQPDNTGMGDALFEGGGQFWFRHQFQNNEIIYLILFRVMSILMPIL